jgi:hypothetical protein
MDDVRERCLRCTNCRAWGTPTTTWHAPRAPRRSGLPSLHLEDICPDCVARADRLDRAAERGRRAGDEDRCRVALLRLEHMGARP